MIDSYITIRIMSNVELDGLLYNDKDFEYGYEVQGAKIRV